MSEMKLGFGLMRLPITDANDQTSIDVEQVKKMVDMFLENGFTYFDTAWMYHAHQSEHVAKTALVDRYPRDKFTLATKLHSSYFNSEEDMDKVFNEQLSKTGAGYFDYYLLHGISAGNYPKYQQYNAFDWMLKKKEQGLIKHIGFSYHDNAELLDRVLTDHPEAEFVQLQLNYLDWNSDSVQSRLCYEVAVKHGKKVVVMEPVKGGALAKVPAAAEEVLKGAAPNNSVASWGIRFAASLENVMIVLSGMSSEEQMKDNLSYMKDFKALSEEEHAVIDRVVDIINSNIAIQCTACSYCTDGCPVNIAIPQYFALFNEGKKLNSGDWFPLSRNYEALVNEGFGAASACLACGQCEGVCPQHLPIIDHLKEVAKVMEG